MNARMSTPAKKSATTDKAAKAKAAEAKKAKAAEAKAKKAAKDAQAKADAEAAAATGAGETPEAPNADPTVAAPAATDETTGAARADELAADAVDPNVRHTDPAPVPAPLPEHPAAVGDEPVVAADGMSTKMPEGHIVHHETPIAVDPNVRVTAAGDVLTSADDQG